jgi:hypothetical protein
VRLPPQAFQRVNKIITILGTSNDIFKPQIRNEKKRSSQQITDVHDWILDLVQSGGSDTLTSRNEARYLHLATRYIIIIFFFFFFLGGFDGF